MHIEIYIYVDIVSFGYLVRQKARFGVLISLATRLITIKMVAVKNLFLEVRDVDWNDMHKKIALMTQGTKEY